MHHEIFHAGGSPKMDEIETPTIASASKRLRGSDFDDETLLRLGEIQSTPPKSSPSAVHHTPITIPFFADVTPPTPPRRPTLSTRNSASPDSPGGVAARRAAAGKLPNKALASLQQMRFEAHDAGMGLGVGPGSPGFGPASPGPVEGMEGLSPGPGMTFRIALGLTNGKDVEGASSPVEEGENVYTNASTLASPTLLRQSSTSSNKRRPFSPSQAGEGVKIPPTLRGSKILDKLNLSSPPTLTSPLSMHRPERAAPPSPLILRTSAFTYSTTGPLTPLTPSHAWVFKKAGAPANVLRLEPAWPVPTPGPGEVLVRVSAAALNPIGYKSMMVFPLTLGQKKPSVPESDVAGTVAGGDLGGKFALGDEVFGITPADKVMKTGRGALAEYTVVDAKLLVKKPANISAAEAAAFPLAGLTAYTALEAGGLKRGAGQRVFINGGSSGTGSWAIQIAKEFGAEVVTTFSDDSETVVKSLNPTASINYHSVNLIEHLSKEYADKPFDLIFDTVGLGALYHASPKFLAPTGVYVDIAGSNSFKSASDVFWIALGMMNKLARPVWLGGTPRRYIFGSLQANAMVRCPIWV
ncbi:hypothetical protein RQP46_001162 [Phenoliferia psychrophenolica]